MSSPEIIYAYRVGQKVKWEKGPYEMVVREWSGRLDEAEMVRLEQVFLATMRVVNVPDELESFMSRNLVLHQHFCHAGD